MEAPGDAGAGVLLGRFGLFRAEGVEVETAAGDVLAGGVDEVLVAFDGADRFVVADGVDEGGVDGGEGVLRGLQVRVGVGPVGGANWAASTRAVRRDDSSRSTRFSSRTAT